MAKIGRKYRIALALASAALVGVCIRGRSSVDPPNILLITIDTVRLDHLSVYGYERNTSPRLSELATQGARFDRAYTASATTGPSHASLFTGLYPLTHGVIKNGLALDESFGTLAGVLAEEGYQTAGIVSSFVLNRKFGYSRGFGTWDDTFPTQTSSVTTDTWEGHNVSEGFDRRADATTDRAAEWLETQRHSDQRFFLFVHYFDPHSPYETPHGFVAGFENPALRGIDNVIQRYDTEIAFTDGAIGRLLDTVAALGLEDSTLVVVTSDHGEGLMQHGHAGHGLHIYEESVRAPLLMRWRNRIPEGKVVQAPVESVDIKPTILGMAGIKNRQESTPGRDLSPQIEGAQPWDMQRPVFLFRRHYSPDGSHGTGGKGTKIGVRLGPWKYIEGPEENSRELFHLASDPGETENLVKSAPTQAALLSRKLGEWSRLAQQDDLPHSLVLEAKDSERLQALGYSD